MITVQVPAGQIQGEVTTSNDPRLPVHTSVGLRLADPEGISEPSATFRDGMDHTLVREHRFTADGDQEVTSELVDCWTVSAQPPDLSARRTSHFAEEAFGPS